MRTKHKYTQTHTQQPLFPLKAWLHQDDSRPLSLLDKDSVSWDDVTTAFLVGVNLCLVEQQQKNLCVALNPHAFGRMKASSALFCCSMWLSSLSFLPLPFLSFEIPAFFSPSPCWAHFILLFSFFIPALPVSSLWEFLPFCFLLLFFRFLANSFFPSHSPSRVRYFRFLYLNPAVSCTFSLRFVFFSL